MPTASAVTPAAGTAPAASAPATEADPESEDRTGTPASTTNGSSRPSTAMGIHDEEPMVVRCPFFESWSHKQRSLNMESLGYALEYTYEIARRGHMELVIKPASNLRDAIRLFENGETDVFPAMHPTPERRKKFLFSKRPLDHFPMSLLVHEDDERFLQHKWDVLHDARIGVVEESVDMNGLTIELDSRKIRARVVHFQNVPELVQALQHREIDAAAISEFMTPPGTRVIDIVSRSVHFAVRKDRPDIMARVDAALEELATTSPHVIRNLHERQKRYLYQHETHTTDFSAEEKAFVATLPPLRVAFESSWEPLEYQDEKTGAFRGIVADIYRQIAAITGLKFDFVCVDDHTAMRLMRQGEIDMVACAITEPFWTEKRVATSFPFLVAPMVLVRQRTDGPIKRMGLHRGFDISPVFAECRQATPVYFESMENCAMALLGNNIDAIYTNIHNAAQLQRRYPEFFIVALTEDLMPLRSAISRSLDPRILSVFNRGILLLASDQLTNIILENAPPHRTTLREFIWSNFTVINLLAILFLCLFVGLVLFSLRQRLVARERLEKLLYVDELTGIGNTNELYRQANILLLRHTKETFLLAFLDIDAFKLVNDQFGFAAGDATLRTVADILRRHAKEGDVLVHMDKDHFALLTRSKEWPFLWHRLDRMKDDFAAFCRAHHYQPAVRLVGGVVALRNRSIPIHRYLEMATYARNHIRDNSRNFETYNARVRKEMERKKYLENRLDKAIANNEFVPFFQPKVHMASGKIVGSEALCRWLDPVEGLLPPMEFVPLFEENRTIDKLDFCIYEAVCRAIRTWLDKGIEVAPVSCNFSGVTFKRQDFVRRVVETAERYRVPYSYLELELTETAYFSNTKELNAKMSDLIARGFHIAIDDFGYGYSSLGQLQHLKAHVLKLDRNFITEGLLTYQANAVLSSVINLAHTIGMDIVCEGVETKDQIQALVAKGCYVAQGYYFAKPMSGENFEALMVAKTSFATPEPLAADNTPGE